MSEFYYKELSEKIIGVFYTVYNQVGWGYRELYYQKLASKEFGVNALEYKGQKSFPLIYKDQIIKLDRPDFLIENKIIVELKVGKNFFKKDFIQLTEYLKALKLKLGLLILISPEGVIPRRVVNLPPAERR
jgi:GxxExxY protein